MRTQGLRSLTFAAAFVTALATLRCNAVLGIEEAQYDPTFVAGASGSSTGGTTGTGGKITGGTGASGTTGASRGSVDVPYPGCIDATPACEQCLSGCSGFSLAACLDKKVCRTAVEDYRACLGSTCGQRGEAEDCRESALYATGEPLVDQLLACVGGSCLEACAMSPLATMCELYCACMKDNCSSKPIAVDQNCVATCRASETRDGTIAHCRKYHCEYNDTPGATAATHCNHAVGIEQCMAPVDPNQECVIPNGIIPTFPCQVGGECCSGRCEAQTCL